LPPEGARRLSLALSTANAPAQAAAWIEGFLANSGLVLLHDEALTQVLDDWIIALSPDHFTAVLPLLRRTFSTFEPAERRQLGARIAAGSKRVAVVASAPEDFDETRAAQALPLVARLLGLSMNQEEGKP
jgi:hypothetical protein